MFLSDVISPLIQPNRLSTDADCINTGWYTLLARSLWIYNGKMVIVGEPIYTSGDADVGRERKNILHNITWLVQHGNIFGWISKTMAGYAMSLM